MCGFYNVPEFHTPHLNARETSDFYAHVRLGYDVSVDLLETREGKKTFYFFPKICY